MKTFNYLELVYEAHVIVRSPDGGVLKWVAEKVESQLPSCDVKYHDQYYLEILNLDDRDKETRWWVMQQLLNDGWEPFSSACDKDGYIQTLLFRKEIGG